MKKGYSKYYDSSFLFLLLSSINLQNYLFDYKIIDLNPNNYYRFINTFIEILLS